MLNIIYNLKKLLVLRICMYVDVSNEVNKNRNNRLYGYKDNSKFKSEDINILDANSKSGDIDESKSDHDHDKVNYKYCGKTNDIIDPSLQTYNGEFISTLFKKEEIFGGSDTNLNRNFINNMYNYNGKNFYKFKIVGQMNNVPNIVYFKEKFEFYSLIEDIFSQIFLKLIVKLDLLNNHNNKMLSNLMNKKDYKYNVICKMQDYQVFNDCFYQGRIHHEGLMSDNIKLVCIYIIEQSFWLSPCILSIGNTTKTYNIETKENMAIVFSNEYDKTYVVTLKNNLKAKQATRKILVFWIIDHDHDPSHIPIPNSLNNHVNLRFNISLIACYWTRTENYDVDIPKDLLLVISKYVSGDLDYIYHNQNKVRQDRSKRVVTDPKSQCQRKLNIPHRRFMSD